MPSISGHHREDLPAYLSRAQLQDLLKGFDRSTLLGKRDYALTLCLARLGLRAGEVARLSLDDVDWRHGWLRLAPPTGPTRQLFRTARGQRPLSGGWLAERVGAAKTHAG